MDYSTYFLSKKEMMVCIGKGILAGMLAAWILYQSVYGMVTVFIFIPLCIQREKKKRREQQKETLLLQFRDAMQSVAAALQAGYSMENAWRESEFGTAAEKLEQRYLLQCRITESGLLRCDQILRNEEGALATRGDDGGTYIVRNWYPGRECETGNSEDLIRASDALARLHTAAHLPVKMEYRRESIVEECIRHNVEIRKIRKYLQTKKKKNEFEKLLLASAGPYLEQGERAAAEMKASSYEKLRQRADEEGAVCHGEFSQHNILLENGRGETAVNFDKWNFDLQVADLGYFMRKILEKHGWSERAAERILNAYSARRPLDEGEIETLRLYLSYPWKYWKLANRYYGSRKSWISGRNTEKLKTLNAQQADWLRFVKGSFF